MTERTTRNDSQHNPADPDTPSDVNKDANRVWERGGELSGESRADGGLPNGVAEDTDDE